MPLEEVRPEDPRNRRISILVLSQIKEHEILLENTSIQKPETTLQDAWIKEVQGYTDGHE